MKRTSMMLGMLVGLSMTGCGLGGNDFVGTWQISSGTVNLSCPNTTVPPQQITGNDTFVEGTDSDIVLTASDGCNTKFNVSGDVATALANQSCTGSDGTVVKITSQVVTLSADKRSYTQNISAEADLKASDGTTVVCSLSGTESGTKVGK